MWRTLGYRKSGHSFADLAGAHIPVGSEWECESSAGEAYLSQCCAQRYGHPIGLLAVVLALHRQGQVDEGARVGHFDGQVAN